MWPAGAVGVGGVPLHVRRLVGVVVVWPDCAVGIGIVRPNVRRFGDGGSVAGIGIVPGHSTQAGVTALGSYPAALDRPPRHGPFSKQSHYTAQPMDV